MNGPHTPLTKEFSPRAEQVLFLAQKEARERRHYVVSTEHLILGIVCLKECSATLILNQLGVDLARLKLETDKEIKLEAVEGRTVPMQTPRVKKVLALAEKEAEALGQTYIGTEHILLGMLRENDGAAATILERLGLTLETTREAVKKLQSPP